MDRIAGIGPQRRRMLLQSAAALGAACIPLALQRVLAAGTKPPGIYRIEGEVRINGAPASLGQMVRPGDVIETGPGSEAIFIVGRDAFLVRAASRIETAGRQLFIGAMRIVTGRLLSVLGPGARRYETRTATIGIRGTGLYVEADPARTYVCTCYGVAEMQARERPELIETVETTHHDQPRYIYADRSMPVEKMMDKAPVINHTDEELVMLEALVGREPPFTGKGGARY